MQRAKYVYSNYFKDIYPDVPIVIANSDTGKQFIKDNNLNFANEPMIFNKVNDKFTGHVIEPATEKYQNHIKNEIKELVQKIKNESDDDGSNMSGMLIFAVTIVAIFVGLGLKYKKEK